MRSQHWPHLQQRQQCGQDHCYRNHSVRARLHKEKPLTVDVTGEPVYLWDFSVTKLQFYRSKYLKTVH